MGGISKDWFVDEMYKEW